MRGRRVRRGRRGEDGSCWTRSGLLGSSNKLFRVDKLTVLLVFEFEFEIGVRLCRFDQGLFGFADRCLIDLGKNARLALELGGFCDLLGFLHVGRSC